PRAPSVGLLALLGGAAAGGATGWAVSVTIGSTDELFFAVDLDAGDAPLPARAFTASGDEELAPSFDAAAFEGCRHRRGTVKSKNATTTTMAIGRKYDFGALPDRVSLADGIGAYRSGAGGGVIFESGTSIGSTFAGSFATGALAGFSFARISA